MMMWLVLMSLQEHARGFRGRYVAALLEFLGGQFAEDFGGFAGVASTKDLAALVFEGESRRGGKPLLVLARKAR